MEEQVIEKIGRDRKKTPEEERRGKRGVETKRVGGLGRRKRAHP
jgi:hypothetical protein